MALSCLGTINNVTNYIQSSFLTIAHPIDEFFSMGLDTGYTNYKWIRNNSNNSSTGTSNIYNESNSKATNVRFSTLYPRLVGAYVFNSNLTNVTGTILQLFSGSASGQSFTIENGTWITLKFFPGLYMQVFHVYHLISDTGQLSSSGKSYMIEGSNDNGVTWTRLFPSTSDIFLNSINNNVVLLTPTDLITTAYNMFKWTFNVNTQTTTLSLVDITGQFYYDNRAISNKLLYYNFEQNPPIDQFGGINSIVSNVDPIFAITNNRSKFGTQSATSNASAWSQVYIRTDTNISLTNCTGISFSFWLYLNGITSGGDTRIFEAGVHDQYFIQIQNNTLTLNWCNRGQVVTVLSGVWMHVVCTINSSGVLQMFIDGVLISNATDINKWVASVGNVYICRSVVGAHHSINGNIDDFKVYSKALTQSEVNAIYANTDK